MVTFRRGIPITNPTASLGQGTRRTKADGFTEYLLAGLHRLLHQLPRLGHADALVVVAGMEGALPSVVGGLVDCPVIAVPTSIGYGANFHGLAALLGMLNSCASNVVVVNIDAGFNGGHVAGLIARRAGLARLPPTAAAPGTAQQPATAAAGSEEPSGAGIPAVG